MLAAHRVDRKVSCRHNKCRVRTGIASTQAKRDRLFLLRRVQPEKSMDRTYHTEKSPARVCTRHTESMRGRGHTTGQERRENGRQQPDSSLKQHKNHLRKTRGGDRLLVELPEQLRDLGAQLRPHGPRHLAQPDAALPLPTAAGGSGGGRTKGNGRMAWRFVVG